MAKLYDLVPYGDKSLVPIWNSLTEQKKKKKKKGNFLSEIQGTLLIRGWDINIHTLSGKKTWGKMAKLFMNDLHNSPNKF